MTSSILPYKSNFTVTLMQMKGVRNKNEKKTLPICPNHLKNKYKRAIFHTATKSRRK
jgi:hypothetical protein